MATTYEYRFDRLGEHGGAALFGVEGTARRSYQEVVRARASEGWRLVQIFAPGTAAFGAARYFELIFERQRAEEPAPSAPGTAAHGGAPVDQERR